MTDNYYDVVVIGRSLGALLAAALLSRRDFRVLLLGNGERSPTYALDRYTFHRSAFLPLFATSPVFRRALVELAQTQTFRRRAVPLDPVTQVLFNDRRLEVPRDKDLFAHEVCREYPDARRMMEEVVAELVDINAGFDEAFDADLVWPPGTFWERRETSKAAAKFALRAASATELFARFAPQHSYQRVFSVFAAFASDAASPPPHALCRLQGALLRGVCELPDGECDVVDFLTERIQAQGGTCRLNDKVMRVGSRRSGFHEVWVDGEASPTGAGFIVFDRTGEELAALADGDGILPQAERQWPLVQVARSRFVLNVLLHRDGIPVPLGGQAFLIPTTESGSSDLEVHLVRMNDRDDPQNVRLVAEVLCAPGDRSIGTMRERIVSMLTRMFPFIDRHFIAIDSPHDGRPVWIFQHGNKQHVERLALRSATNSPEAMVPQYKIGEGTDWGLAVEPLRGPLRRSFLVGRSVLPSLGQEGMVLAACGAARLITRTDRQKEKIRRAMWSKVEIG